MLKEIINNLGLYVYEENDGKLKGTSCNIIGYPVFRVWINKSNKLTVKTRGLQKSFGNWENEIDNILKGFEIK